MNEINVTDFLLLGLSVKFVSTYFKDLLIFKNLKTMIYILLLINTLIKSSATTS